MNYQRFSLLSTESTNTYLRQLRPMPEDPITLVTTEYQTAGRGQRGNSWESEAGSNLLYSLLVHPTTLRPSQMFSLSEVAALSVCQSLNEILAAEQEQEGMDSCKSHPSAQSFCVKWPNDIYYGDSKVAGMLIETDLMGSRIANAIIGVGVNLNQRRFLSNAPNPISLCHITGHDTSPQLVMDTIMKHFTRLYAQLEAGQLDDLHQDFMQHLYRREGFHPYQDASGSFRARIVGVELTGHLILEDTEGRTRRYAFKEVTFCHTPKADTGTTTTPSSLV